MRHKKRSILKVFIGCATKKGKKRLIKKIFDKVLKSISRKLDISSKNILRIVLSKLDLRFEIKTRKVRKNTSFVPVPVFSARRKYLVVKRVLTSIEEDKTKRSFEEKLKEEFTKLVTNKACKSLSKKNDILKQAILNKANSHYRW